MRNQRKHVVINSATEMQKRGKCCGKRVREGLLEEVTSVQGFNIGGRGTGGAY